VEVAGRGTAATHENLPSRSILAPGTIITTFSYEETEHRAVL
jgi:hypothetical protein